MVESSKTTTPITMINKNKKSKTVRMAVLLPEDVRDMFKEICENDLRSMSNQTAELIAQYVKRNKRRLEDYYE